MVTKPVKKGSPGLQVPPCKLVVGAFNDSDFFWFTRSLIDCPGVPVGHYAVAASMDHQERARCQQGCPAIKIMLSQVRKKALPHVDGPLLSGKWYQPAFLPQELISLQLKRSRF